MKCIFDSCNNETSKTWIIPIKPIRGDSRFKVCSDCFDDIKRKNLFNIIEASNELKAYFFKNYKITGVVISGGPKDSKVTSFKIEVKA